MPCVTSKQLSHRTKTILFELCKRQTRQIRERERKKEQNNKQNNTVSTRIS